MKRYSLLELNSVVKDMDEKPVMVQVEQGRSEPLTVRYAFRRALNTEYVDEQANPAQNKPGLSFEKKSDRYNLAKKIWYGDAPAGVELSSEQVSELKLCIGKAYGGEVLGFLNDIIEQKPVLGGSVKVAELTTGNGTAPAE